MPLLYILVFILGLIFGSFITAYSYRWPRGMSLNGRSKCDNCGWTIFWYDNIPLFSYLALKGRCRHCHKHISLRYPLIEFSTGLIFLAIFNTYFSCLSGPTLQNIVCTFHNSLGIYALPFLFALNVALMAILVIDLETQYIPDELTFFILLLSSVFVFIFSENLYLIFFVAIAGSLFFLFSHFITRGKGMGLGDVKLALAGGVFFGWPALIAWFYCSFLLGAFIGILLIIFGKAKFRKPIAFGPFLVLAWFITLFWGDKLVSFLLPIL